MTTVLVLARSMAYRAPVKGLLRWAVLVFLAAGHTAKAQEGPVHWLHAGAMPPGAIGSLRLQRGGPLSGYFQPVRIRAPQGARIALAVESGAAPAQPNQVLVGMHVGPVYRLHVTEIPDNPGIEVFPTIEVIDRLYPPPGLALRYPILVELTLDELQMAADGAFVTRVIYVEDPHQALPVHQPLEVEQPWFEAPAGEDPLITADRYGRPVAILRMGGRMPASDAASRAHAGGAPPLMFFDASAVDCPSGDSSHQSVEAAPLPPTLPAPFRLEAGN